jgi:hypothetical protein
MSNFGLITSATIYGVTGKTDRTLELLDKISNRIGNGQGIIVGDFNMDQNITKDWAATRVSAPRVLDFGKTCYSHSGSTNIDHAIITNVLAKILPSAPTHWMWHSPLTVPLRPF